MSRFLDAFAAFINENGISGIHLEPSSERAYPFGTLASQIIGFTNASKAQVWAGIQTYTHLPGSQDVKGMSASDIRADSEVIRSTKCSGVVMFRYALGEFPDVNDLWN